MGPRATARARGDRARGGEGAVEVELGGFLGVLASGDDAWGGVVVGGAVSGGAETDAALAAAWWAAAAVMAVALAVAAREDLERRVIPNGCCLAVAASGLVAAALRAGAGVGPSALAGSVLGVAVVLAVMLLAAAASRRATGRPGVGGGDVKLLAAAGAWAGPVWGLVVVAGSCVASLALCGLSRILAPLCRHKGVMYRLSDTAGGIPLGPGIALIALAVALLGAR